MHWHQTFDIHCDGGGEDIALDSLCRDRVNVMLLMWQLSEIEIVDQEEGADAGYLYGYR